VVLWRAPVSAPCVVGSTPRSVSEAAANSAAAVSQRCARGYGMITYRIEHRTTYTYDSDVTGSYGLFHLRPRDLRWQRCVANEIAIEPEPAELFRHVDLYGNAKGYFHVVEPHTALV